MSNAPAPLIATEEDIHLIRQSFAALQPVADRAGILFYDRLFECHPELRPMFPLDIKPQAKKLMSALALVVASLDRFETILPTIEDLARRHRGYGVEPRHYQLIEETLVWMLSKVLGDAFTARREAAWLTAYAALAGVMIIAAEQTAPASLGGAA